MGAGKGASTFDCAFHHMAGELMIKSIAPGEYRVLGDVNGDGAQDFGIEVFSTTPVSSADFVL